MACIQTMTSSAFEMPTHAPMQAGGMPNKWMLDYSSLGKFPWEFPQENTFTGKCVAIKIATKQTLPQILSVQQKDVTIVYF